MIEPLGAGKTTFCNELSVVSGIPSLHLDREFLQPGYKKPPAMDWMKKVNKLVQSPSWIMNGNYFDVLQPRLERAEVLFYLNFSQGLCLGRYIRRTIKMRGSIRSDTGLPDRINLPHWLHVATYKLKKRHRFQSTLRQAERLGTKIVVFHTPAETHTYLSFARSSAHTTT